MKIAVLLTTFNRKQKTIACLQSLQQQSMPKDVVLDVHLTDDASADGTAEAVKANFPGTNVYTGTGNLFWAGGMRQTWKQAIQTNPDFYLLLNDDTILNENAITVLLDTNDHSCISIGSTCDKSGNLSYGGWKLSSSFFWKNKMVYSDTEQLTCDFGNANIMLVPARVVERIGILSDRFTHALADFDYTLKASRSGFAVRLAPGFLGSCENDHGNNWKSGKVSLKQRIAYLKSPKGLSYSEYLYFIKNHFPLSYPSAVFKLWMKTLFPFIWDVYKRA